MKISPSALLFAAAISLMGIAAAALAQIASIPGVVEVFSDQAEYTGTRSIFSGNVTLAAGQMTLAADKLEVQVGADGNLYRATGKPVQIQCARCFGGDAIARAESVRYNDSEGIAVADGNARICSGAKCENANLFAHQLEWRRDENAFIARGNPEAPPPDNLVRLAWNPPGGESISVSAKEIRYDMREQSATLAGDAEAVRGESSLRGETIFYNRKTGAMRAEADSKGGRVRAVFGVEKDEERQ